MQIVPLNYDLAKFCFSRSKFFLVKKDKPSIRLSQNLINIFDEEFNNELSKHGMILVDVSLPLCHHFVQGLDSVLDFQNKA